MGGSTDNARSNQVLDFTPPDDSAGESMKSLSLDNGLGSLKLNEVKNINYGSDTKSGNDNVIDFNKPIESNDAPGSKTLPTDATKAPPTDPSDATRVNETTKASEATRANDATGATDAPKVSERAETSIDLKFDQYNLPDGGKLLVGKSDHKDLPFKPVILDKDGKFVRNTGGGGGGGVGPNGERLPESRSNSYSNGASDRYTEGEDKYHYTDANGKEHSIQLKDKISFKEAEEPEVEPAKELGPDMKLDPSKSLEENLKEGLPADKAATIKAKEYELPGGDKFVTWEFDGKDMRPLVMHKNGETYMVRGGGGGGGGGGIDANGNQFFTKSPNQHQFTNGGKGSWNDGSTSYTYTDRSGKSTVLQLNKAPSL